MLPSRRPLNLAMVTMVVFSAAAHAEYKNINITETLDFVSGPSTTNPVLHPTNESGLRLAGGGNAVFSCTDYAQPSAIRQQFQTLTFDANQGFVQWVGVNLQAGSPDFTFQSITTPGTSVFDEGSVTLFTEFQAQRDLSGFFGCPLDFSCEVTETYDVSYADTRSGQEYEATRMVETSINYLGSCLDLDGNTVSCPFSTSCREVWRQSGELVDGFPAPQPSWSQEFLQWVKDVVPGINSEGDIQQKTKTVSTGPRG